MMTLAPAFTSRRASAPPSWPVAPMIAMVPVGCDIDRS
jgi:hypothetical protein